MARVSSQVTNGPGVGAGPGSSARQPRPSLVISCRSWAKAVLSQQDEPSVRPHQILVTSRTDPPCHISHRSLALRLFCEGNLTRASDEWWETDGSEKLEQNSWLIWAFKYGMWIDIWTNSLYLQKIFTIIKFCGKWPETVVTNLGISS